MCDCVLFVCMLFWGIKECKTKGLDSYIYIYIYIERERDIDIDYTHEQGYRFLKEI